MRELRFLKCGLAKPRFKNRNFSSAVFNAFPGE